MGLRVAVVTESFLPQVNGVTNSVVRVLETYKQSEIEAMVIAPTSPSPRHLGFEVHQVANIPLLQFAVGVPSPSITRELDAFAPDLVHVAAPFLMGAQAIGWASRNQVPSVAIYQTDVAGYLQRYNLAFARPVMERLLGSIHQGATLNLAPTKASVEYLQQVGVPRVKQWGRGVDLDLFHPQRASSIESQQLRRRVSPSGRAVIGFVGRLAQEKQVHRMAELFGLDADFLVVGDGPEAERLKSQFGSRAHFTGLLSGLDLAAAYGAIDVFVHFGEEETFGQTIQEAQASGLAVVAPAAGGPLELIDSGESGFLVQPNQPFTPVVARLIEDASLRLRIAEAGRRRVLGKSWWANNAQLLEHYEWARRHVASREVLDELA